MLKQAGVANWRYPLSLGSHGADEQHGRVIAAPLNSEELPWFVPYPAWWCSNAVPWGNPVAKHFWCVQEHAGIKPDIADAWQLWRIGECSIPLSIPCGLGEMRTPKPGTFPSSHCSASAFCLTESLTGGSTIFQ